MDAAVQFTADKASHGRYSQCPKVPTTLLRYDECTGGYSDYSEFEWAASRRHETWIGLLAAKV